jgi:hypothetical protein
VDDNIQKQGQPDTKTILSLMPLIMTALDIDKKI